MFNMTFYNHFNYDIQLFQACNCYIDKIFITSYFIVEINGNITFKTKTYTKYTKKEIK